MTGAARIAGERMKTFVLQEQVPAYSLLYMHSSECTQDQSLYLIIDPRYEMRWCAVQGSN